ncbi:hypothetical protein C2845_PM06G25080 [Panicum miliaceum]|uniref:Uncharacterized protein n=1 Tax=Panicum miliaceum TaxID=4540 RepID=A0A3L6RF40_PANMI|nr:hypothetical protein C2845_PM06G25080 [Panicum miliaceum]
MEPNQSKDGSQGAFPGGNIPPYQAALNPYMYGYQGPPSWFPQGLPQLPPNVSMMHPSTNGPQVFHPTENANASAQNDEEDVEEQPVSPAPTGKGKRTKVGTTFTFGSWICIANGSGGFNNSLANPRKLEESAPTSSHDIDNLADDLGRIKLSNLIGSYASDIKIRWTTALPNASSSWKPLSIGLTQRPRHGTALRLLTILLSPLATSSPASTLQRINLREPKAFDRDFDDFISKLKTPRPSPIRSEAVLPKTLSELEEDLDHLLQLGEEEATGHPGATVYNNHSDSATHATPIIGSR